MKRFHFKNKSNMDLTFKQIAEIFKNSKNKQTQNSNSPNHKFSKETLTPSPSKINS